MSARLAMNLTKLERRVEALERMFDEFYSQVYEGSGPDPVEITKALLGEKPTRRKKKTNGS